MGSGGMCTRTPGVPLRPLRADGDTGSSSIDSSPSAVGALHRQTSSDERQGMNDGWDGLEDGKETRDV
jgi:hypothetical protein